MFLRRWSMIVIVLAAAIAACGDDDGDSRADTVNPPTSTSTANATATATMATEPTATHDSTPTTAPVATEPIANSPATNTPDVRATEEPTATDGPTATEKLPTATGEVSATSTEPDPEPDQIGLSSALLTLEDMPIGWTTAPELIDEDEDGEENGTQICGQQAPNDRYDWQNEVNAAFKQSNLGPIISQRIGTLPDGQAAEALQYIRELLTCSEYVDPDGETITISPLNLRAFGDETFMFRLGSGIFDFNMAYIRVGDAVMLITHAGSGATLDSQFTVEVMELATLRLEKVQQ